MTTQKTYKNISKFCNTDIYSNIKEGMADKVLARLQLFERNRLISNGEDFTSEQVEFFIYHACQDILKDYTVRMEVGDSVYVDNNETFNIVEEGEKLYLIDFNGDSVARGHFINISQVESYLHTCFDKVDIIKNYTISEESDIVEEIKVENKTLVGEDELLLKMLHDVTTNECEYCLDLGYNNEKTWTVEERLDSLSNVINTYKGLSTYNAIHELINNHGYDYFESIRGFDNDYTELFGNYDFRTFMLGDMFIVEQHEDRFIVIQTFESGDGETVHYNILNTNKHSVFLETDDFTDIPSMMKYMESQYGKVAKI
jgi:hypothetical protein